MQPRWKLASFLALPLAASLLAPLGCSEARPRHRWDPYQEARRNDARCDAIKDRIDEDRSKIREIGPTGRHRDALRWYEEDLDSAQRDLDRCRYGS